MTRSEQGYPVVLKDGKQCVPADALALLSGVNFSSVEKVLAAIQALHQYSGTDMQELLALLKVPTQRVVLGDERFARRESDTIRVCRNVARHVADPDIQRLLHLSERFHTA